MLLVMDTAGIFHSADSRTGYSDLWEITWERIVCFLPKLKDELFKQTVIQGMCLCRELPSLYVEPVNNFFFVLLSDRYSDLLLSLMEDAISETWGSAIRS